VEVVINHRPNRHLARLGLSLVLALGVLVALGVALADRLPGVAHADGTLSPFWAEDFSTPIDPAKYYVYGTSGAGVINSGSFLLTPYSYSQYSRIWYTNTLAYINEFTTSFRLNFGQYITSGGDGIVFGMCPHYSYKPAPVPPPATDGLVDAMCPGGYLLDFDTFEGSLGEEPDRVYVAYENQNARLIQQDLGFRLTGWRTVSVEFEQGDINVTVDTTPVIVAAHIPGYVPFWGYFGFAADTGGSGRGRNEQRVDDIQVYATAPGPAQSEIWVDDDFGPATPGWGVTATNSVTQAMWLVEPPGTVRVLTGTYPTTWDMPLVNGGHYMPTLWMRPGVAILGSGPWATTLDGQNRNRTVVGGYWALDNTDVFSGFTVQGGHAYDWHTQAGGGLDLWAGIEKIVNCRVINNAGLWGGGVALLQSNVTLINLMVADNQAQYSGSGVYLIASSSRLLYNTVAHNLDTHSSGVYADNAATAALTNTIVASETTGVYAAAGSHVTVHDILWGDGAWANTNNTDGPGSIGGIATTLSGDPAFLNPSAGDYHIGASSAARNWATNIPDVRYDIDGQPRNVSQGELPDLGADEYVVFVGNERQYLPMLTH